MSQADSDPDADAIERLFDRGVTDGLPVVPPTRERVEHAIAASGRAPDELIALVPPNYGRATVEKIAVNAVMAGCRAEYLPVVLAAVEAICDEAFDLHGVSATTNAPAPLVIVNGPVRAELEINSGAGVFGPGWRANATIGRAVRLVCVNLGGARPGDVSMSTLAHPGRYAYCIGEQEEASPWESLAAEHGFGPDESTVARGDADSKVRGGRGHRGGRGGGRRRTVVRDGAGLDVVEGLGARRQEDASMTEYLAPTDSVAVPRETASRPAGLGGKVITLL